MSSINFLGNISSVPQTTYDQAEAYIQSLLEETHEDRNFNRGSSLFWALVVPAAQSAGVNLENAGTIVSSTLLKSLRDNPDTANSDLVDLILSNYYITAESALNASGNVNIKVSRQTQYVIPAGTVFISNGLRYVTTQAYYIYADSNQVTLSSDRLLQSLSDGNYEFTVPVQAQESGSRYFVAQGSTLEMLDSPQEVISVVAAGDISGGKDTETTKELINRIPDTLATQTFGSRNSIRSLIQSNYPGTKVSVIGMGDAELHRDTHNLLGISTGGMADVLVATQSSINTKKVEVTGTLQSVSDRVWEITVPDSITSGIYTIASIYPKGSEVGITDFEISRGYWLPDSDYVPRITKIQEAAYSKYQTISVIFNDTITSHAGLSVGDTLEYDVVVYDMPLVESISDFITDADRVDPTTNVLVRGAIPCVVDVSMEVRLLDSDFEDDIDTASLKSAIVSKIYNLGFNFGTLSSSLIMDAAHDYLSGRSNVGATTVTIRGEILAPDGSTLFLNDGKEITIPDRYDLQVSKKTTIFLTNINRIDIQYTRVSL